MEEYFAQNEMEVEITSLIVTHKSENEYKGIVNTVEPEGNFDYTVEIIYDGENMTKLRECVDTIYICFHLHNIDCKISITFVLDFNFS